MLTQHNYAKIDQAQWDKDIKECCQTTPPGDQPCTDCCYDSWETELTKVNPAYYASVENADQLQKRVDFVNARLLRYKSWVDELNKAETLARDICSQLKLIAVQSDKIWFNACKAEKAIEILFCMIRDIFMQVDELKTLVTNLQNCIDRNNDPAVNKGQGILKFFEDYKTKLDATVKTRDDIIKNIILAVQLASLLRNGISTADCDTSYTPCADNPTPCVTVTGAVYYGFKTVICEWYNAFACDTACTDTPTPPPAATQSGSQGGTTPPFTDCNPNCELIPTFDFPICNNGFKNDVVEWVNADVATLAGLMIDLNNARMKKEALLACKTSLDLALKTVDPSIRCK